MIEIKLQSLYKYTHTYMHRIEKEIYITDRLLFVFKGFHDQKKMIEKNTVINPTLKHGPISSFFFFLTSFSDLKWQWSLN